MQEYNWAQGKLNELTGTDAIERHEAQRRYNETRTDRRARERAEMKAAQREVKKVKA